MQNLQFNDGLVRLAINGNESKIIEINPTDFGMVSRYQKMQDKLEELTQKYSDIAENDTETGMKILEQLDAEVRKIVDFIVGSEISDTVFGSVNCLSFAGGATIFENFLEAYSNYLEPAIKAEFEKSQEKISKYTKQVK